MILYVPQYKQIKEYKELKDIENMKPLNEAFDFDNLFDEEKSETADEIIMNDIEVEQNLPLVERFLKFYDVDDYEIAVENGQIAVDVHNHLYLPNRGLSAFKTFFFRTVDGNCNFSNNNFTSFVHFPRYIKGKCIANFNYIKNFDGAPDCAIMDASKQRVKTAYTLNNENYQKYTRGELKESLEIPVNKENRVFIISENAYGELQGVSFDNKYGRVLMESDGQVKEFLTTDIDCNIDILPYLLS